MTSLILRPSCPTCASFTFVVRRTSFVLQTWAALVRLWRRWRLSAIRIVWKMSLSFVTWRWLSSSEAGVSKSCTLMPSIAISPARPLTTSGLLRYSFVTGANSRPVFRMCVCTAYNTGRKRLSDRTILGGAKFSSALNYAPEPMSALHLCAYHGVLRARLFFVNALAISS